MPRPIPTALAALTALALALPAAADARDVTPLPPRDVTDIASYAGTTAWVAESGEVAVRAGGRTRALKLGRVRDLDLGPGPTGRTTLVFSRCMPSCDVFLLDVGRARARPVKVDVAARPGVPETVPTIWRDRIAFSRGQNTYVAPVDNGRARVVNEGGVDDLELGPNGALAFAALFDSDDAQGETGVILLDLDRGRDYVTVEAQGIGEGSSAAFGGLTFEADGLWYARIFGNGCAAGKRKIGRFDLRRRRTAAAPRSGAPLAARAVMLERPETAESSFCDEER